MHDESQIDFETLLAGAALRVEAMLDALLGARPLPGELARPERLLAAMRHGVLNGGKRLRPFLVLESAALFGRRWRGDPARRGGARMRPFLFARP